MAFQMSRARDKVRVDYQEMSDFLERMPPPSGGHLEGGGKSIARENQEKLSANTVSLHGVHRYPEWSFQLNGYRQDWTQIKEYRPKGLDPHFVDRTFSEYAHEREQLKRLFERIRPQRQRPRRGLSDGSI